jgi:DNA-binding beta-propeller fold protein YncE
VAVDQEGYIYLTGHAGSKDFPTENAQSPACTLGSLGSCNDAFVAKLDPSGQKLIYSTYFGGSRSEEGTAIAVDSQGRALVAGVYEDNHTFILLLDRNGKTIRSWYVFGSSTTGTSVAVPTAVAFDPDGNVLVAGETLSDRLSLVRPVQAQAGEPCCLLIG